SVGAIVFWAWNGVLAAFSVLDLLTLPPLDALSAEREAPDQVDLGRRFHVLVKLRIADDGAPKKWWIEDDLPQTFEREPCILPSSVSEAGGVAEITVPYTVRPKERGKYTLRTVFVRLLGTNGLWQRQAHLPCEQAI